MNKNLHLTVMKMKIICTIHRQGGSAFAMRILWMDIWINQHIKWYLYHLALKPCLLLLYYCPTFYKKLHPWENSVGHLCCQIWRRLPYTTYLIRQEEIANLEELPVSLNGFQIHIIHIVRTSLRTTFYSLLYTRLSTTEKCPSIAFVSMAPHPI